MHVHVHKAHMYCTCNILCTCTCMYNDGVSVVHYMCNTITVELFIFCESTKFIFYKFILI